MSKIVAFLFLVFFGFIVYLGFMNQDSVTIKLTASKVYEIPMVIFILISSLSGAFLMLVVYTIRDTRRLINNIQTQKRLKKEEKIQSLYSRALGYLYSGKIDVAKDTFKEILSEDSKHIGALLKLAELALKEDDYNAAQDYYKKVLSADPGNIEALLSLASIKVKQNAYDEALKYIDDILERDSGNIAAIYKKREVFELQQRWGDLISLQKEIIKLVGEKESEAEQTRLMGYKYESATELLEKGELEKAKKLFKAIIKIDNGFIPAHLGLAEAMVQEGKSEDAIDYLEKVYEETRSMIVLVRLEDLLLSASQPSRIINIYRKGLADRPQDNTLKFFLAKLYYRLEMLDDALEVIEGMDDESIFPELTKIKGAIYMKRGQLDRAAEEFRKALDMRKTLKIPYCCTNCGEVSEEWSGRCPSCGSWNSYDFNVHGVCKAGKEKEG